jgi:hypothetical protein
MSRNLSTRLADIRRRTLITVVALMVPLTALGAASSALATPKGIFAVFQYCPTGTPGVVLCQFGQTTSGEFTIGSTTVPINQTITLQGGAISTGKTNQYFLVPATNGESLSKTELNVPGGLLGINCSEIKGEGPLAKKARKACEAVFEGKLLGVTATTELVASATNPAILDVGALFAEEGTAITLPVRLHLKNPLLGSGCYIGSESSPVQLHLTTGTTSPPEPNKPISGTRGTFEVEEDEEGREVDVLRENSLVDNAFSSPAAEGCGGKFSSIIDPIVNKKLSLPAAAGHNTAILSGTLKTATAQSVVESEE